MANQTKKQAVKRRRESADSWSLVRRGKKAIMVNEVGWEAATFDSYPVAQQFLAALELTTADQRLKYLMERGK
jgi:hypothetical protein